jgi:hypothetical protein
MDVAVRGPGATTKANAGVSPLRFAPVEMTGLDKDDSSIISIKRLRKAVTTCV